MGVRLTGRRLSSCMYERAEALRLGGLGESAVTNDKELEILTQVYQAQEKKAASSQRSIAQAAGMSLGMTNAILKRLAEKGFVMMRRVNSRNVHYLVTPEGVDEVAKRSYRYLRRTVGHVVRYKERVREFCKTQRAAGRRHIVLLGPSDLTFLVEWCAEKEGLSFRAEPEAERYFAQHGGGAGQAGAAPADGTVVLLLAENVETKIPALSPDIVQLAEILVREL